MVNEESAEHFPGEHVHPRKLLVKCFRFVCIHISYPLAKAISTMLECSSTNTHRLDCQGYNPTTFAPINVVEHFMHEP